MDKVWNKIEVKRTFYDKHALHVPILGKDFNIIYKNINMSGLSVGNCKQGCFFKFGHFDIVNNSSVAKTYYKHVKDRVAKSDEVARKAAEFQRFLEKELEDFQRDSTVDTVEFIRHLFEKRGLENREDSPHEATAPGGKLSRTTRWRWKTRCQQGPR